MAKKNNTPPQPKIDEVMNAQTNDLPEASTNGAATEAPQTPDTESAPANSPLAALQAEAAKNLEGWQRTLAEFQNYKRRVEREQQDIRERIALDVLRKFLPVMDDFERAMGIIPDEFKENPWLNGVTLIQGKFKKLLEEHQVSEIDPVGQVFDPNIHQAVVIEDSDEVESGHVIATLQKGFISGSTLLRPALVKVAN